MRNLIAKLTLVATLGAAASGAALAHAYEEGDGSHFPGHPKSVSAVATASDRASYGTAVSGQPDRIVTLGKDAKYLNVTRMETVGINVAGKSVTWNFDTLGTPNFLLSDIIPEAKGIRVYVSEIPGIGG